jgi:protease IV
MDLPPRLRAVRPPLLLALDLASPVTDEAAPSPLRRALRPAGQGLRQLVELLEQAAEDPRVRGLVARIDHPAGSWAHAQEIRAAVLAFRRAGKPAIAHAQSFGEAGGATLAYLVASAFAEVHLQPSGDVGALGVAAEVPFLAEALAKLDIEPQVDRRHEYKSAANLVTERGFTDAHREAVDRIVASHHEQLMTAVAEGRGLSAEAAAAVVDRTPLSAQDALDAGLVDRLAYRDEAVAAAKERAGEGVRLVTVRGYRRTRRWRMPELRRPATVALVHGQGAIAVGRSRRSLAGQVMGADTVVAGFQQAIRDRRVRAILFRVDSPGGSAVASDAIWRAVVRAREAGKPVIVSMGSVAGSGGYWVSMAADRIVAAPGTITGSIGVVIGKLVVRGLRERLGVTTDEAHRGANALMFSSNQRFTDEQWGAVQRTLDRVYDAFVAKVAEGRGLTREQVHEVARGRVWTGADALERGLVDELGGYAEALRAVRGALGLDADAPLRLRPLPRQPAAERLGLREPDPEDARLLREAAALLGEVAGAERGAARMPGWATRFR